MQKRFQEYTSAFLFWLRGNRLFFLLFISSAVYYLWRLFYIPPWYDELYTYQTFIDRGVIYSMIHWPLPNNHVFFSALSALVNKLGNPWLGLRGVSFLASMGSLALLYRLLKKSVSPRAAATGCGLFASMYNITQQAAQGRGYALSGFFLLAALNLLHGICVPEEMGQRGEKDRQQGEKDGEAVRKKTSGAAGREKENRTRKHFWQHPRFRLYAGFAFCLTAGLYTIPSNLYWVLSICLAGGLFLLWHKQFARLFRLIGASACAAAAAFVLYSVIWLSTGSNYLVKDAASSYYGMSHFQMLLESPVDAFLRGMTAMLADPNIQSVDRQFFMEGFAGYLGRLMNQVWPGGSRFLPILIPLAFAAVAGLLWHSLKKKNKSTAFLSLTCLIFVLMVPVVLSVQCVFPYLRVFTYMGSVLAMLFVLAVKAAADAVRYAVKRAAAYQDSGKEAAAGMACAQGGFMAGGLQKKPRRPGPAGMAFLSVFSALCLPILLWSLSSYRAGYDSRDDHIYAALRQLDETEVDTVMVGDVYARLNLYFHIEKCRGKKLTEDVSRPDYVLMDKLQTGPAGEGLIWPFERNTQDFPWEWIDEHMEVVFEDDAYIAFQVKE